MGLGKRMRLLANSVLRPFGMSFQRQSEVPQTEWDRQFSQWIREAEAAGRDPNDIGDERWGEDLLDVALSEHYLPHVDSDSVVLELGPGTGRLTRHLIGRCREVVAVDASTQVCDWIRRYLKGKGQYRVHRIDGPLLAMVPDESIDAVLAHGVVEHLDVEEIYWFLVEFHRVLRPGGIVAFNFDNVLADRGIEVMRQDGPGKRALFRLHHPDTIRRLAEVTGFADVRLSCPEGRIGFANIMKQGTPGPGG